MNVKRERITVMLMLSAWIQKEVSTVDASLDMKEMGRHVKVMEALLVHRDDKYMHVHLQSNIHTHTHEHYYYTCIVCTHI